MKIKLMRIGIAAIAVSALSVCPVWADDPTNPYPPTTIDPSTQTPEGGMRLPPPPPPPPPKNWQQQQQPSDGSDSTNTNQLWPNSSPDGANSNVPSQGGPGGNQDPMMGGPNGGMGPDGSQGRGMGPDGQGRGMGPVPGRPQDMRQNSNPSDPAGGMGPGPGSNVPGTPAGGGDPNNNYGSGMSRATPSNKHSQARNLKLKQKNAKKSSASKHQQRH